eukprot:2955076-Amphidinium_carterae.1
MVYPEAPFQLGQHLRVTDWKSEGTYNFAYLTSQSCRTLKKRKKKKRGTGFGAAEARVADPAATPPPGGATESAAAAADGVPQARVLRQPAPRRTWPIFRQSVREPD